MGKSRAQKAEKRADRKTAREETAPVKQFARKRRTKPKQDTIVLSDDDDNHCEEKSQTAQRGKQTSKKASLVFHKKHEGRWEDSEISSDRKSSRQKSSSREGTSDGSEETSQDAGDSWRPSKAKLKRSKAGLTSPGGSVHINPTGRSKVKKQLDGNSLRMPPAEWQLEHENTNQTEGWSDKKAAFGKTRRKRGKEQEAQEPGAQVAKTARPAPAQDALPAPAAKRRSHFFLAAGAPSQAGNSLKAFKKKKMLDSSSLAREAPANGESAELATADLGIPGSKEVGRSKHATPMVSPRSRTTASSPDDFYISKQPHIPTATVKACSPASASVQIVASTPSPSRAQQGQSPAQRQPIPSQRHPSSAEAKKVPASPRLNATALATSEALDRVGDWNPHGKERQVSSEAEAGPSPNPSSILVEADDSPQPSQSVRQLQPSQQKPAGSPGKIIPETQQQNSADADQQESVSIVDDTPEKTSWATGEDSGKYQPTGSLERGQEGSSAEQNIEQEAKEQSLVTPPHSRQKPLNEISSAFEADLNALDKCTDTELKSRLPQMEGSREALALLSAKERRDKISAALQMRDAEKPSVFQQKLFKNMGEKGAARREREANASATSPLAARETHPRKPRKHTEPSAPAKMLALAAEQPANMKVALWEPPASPYFLIEEVLYDDPWKLLVACMLLNKTTGRAVRKILYQLFELCPTPEAAIEADIAVVESIIKPLGLFRKRAVMFKRFSREYIEKQWTDPRQLHGMGQYAADAFNLFCRNKWRDMQAPQDKDLLQYYQWLVDTDGQGCGYEREVFVMPSNSQSTSLKDGRQIIDICSPAVESKARAGSQKRHSPKQ